MKSKQQTGELLREVICNRTEKLTKRKKGLPQGSPLSPLLSNIMLNEPDKEMEKQGLRHVRYADDFSIFTKSNMQPARPGIASVCSSGTS
ncbi:MAG: hypothetical protein JXA03_12660 [Bacteroidales bacterium]|nr:hypothetical protein [Bacteroidales bacterium]